MTAGLLSLMASPASGVAGFGDVEESAFYTRAVQWMVDNNITTGTSPTCFSPGDPVTRGQAAAFMWRMEGEPAAPAHSFTDVPAGYQQAPVSWMASAGITTGTSPSTYSPNDELTRGQLAALVHRLAEEPAASGHPFNDVTASWQQTPVAWMVANGITTGTSPTTFSPNDTVTRGQLATFFYRFKGNPPVTVNFAHPTLPSCAQQVPGPTTTTTTTTTTPPRPIEFSGTGDDVIVIPAASPASAGYWAATLMHTGSSNFSITLKDAGGGWVDLLVNHIGAYEGVRPYGFDPFGLSDPIRFIEVSADGDWEITLRPLSSTPALGSSVGSTRSGTGDTLLRFGNGGAPSVVQFDCSDCVSNVALWSYGSDPDLLVNEIADGSPFTSSFLVPAETVLIEIEVSGFEFAFPEPAFLPGHWSIRVK